jgi:adenosine deaminase CECR1
MLFESVLTVPCSFVRDRHGSPEDPNRPVMTLADSPKKRKRALSAQPTRKIPLHSGEPKTTDMSSENTKTVFEKKAEAHFDTVLGSVNQAVSAYENERQSLVKADDSAWDRQARPKDRSRLRDDKTEERAAAIIRAIREYERVVTFGNRPSEALPLEEDRDMGGQYLTNKNRIDNQSKLYEIAKIVPKGALLHLHFNAELHPEILLVRARKMKNMYIRSIIPITEEKHLGQTEMLFNVCDPETVDPEVDIFSDSYPRLMDQENPKAESYLKTTWMPWSKFQVEFERKFPGLYKDQEPETFQAGRPHQSHHCGERKPAKLSPAENWLRSKMVLSHDEAYGPTQTVNGYVSCSHDYNTH